MVWYRVIILVKNIKSDINVCQSDMEIELSAIRESLSYRLSLIHVCWINKNACNRFTFLIPIWINSAYLAVVGSYRKSEISKIDSLSWLKLNFSWPSVRHWYSKVGTFRLQRDISCSQIEGNPGICIWNVFICSIACIHILNIESISCLICWQFS